MSRVHACVDEPHLFPDDFATVVTAHAEQRTFERDYTPRPVAQAVVDWHLDNIFAPLDPNTAPAASRRFRETWNPHGVPDKELYVLDTNAGAGVWASAVRVACHRRGVPVRIVAVEINPAEALYLRRHADVVHIGGWREQAERFELNSCRFDLVIGNPAFSQARAPQHPQWQAYRAAAKHRRAALKMSRPAVQEFDAMESMPAIYKRISTAVVLYTSQQGWTKTESGYAVRLEHPPAVALDIPGSINHRVGKNPENDKRYSADSVPYSTNMWLAGRNRSTETFLLPPLKTRSWKPNLRPGAEPDEWLRANGIPTVHGEVYRLLDGVPVEQE